KDARSIRFCNGNTTIVVPAQEAVKKSPRNPGRLRIESVCQNGRLASRALSPCGRGHDGVPTVSNGVRGLSPRDHPSPINFRGSIELPSPARGEGAITSTAWSMLISSQPLARGRQSYESINEIRQVLKPAIRPTGAGGRALAATA